MDDSPCSDVMDQGKERELESLFKGIQQFDDIRFASYRTAVKIRYLQRRGSLHLLDIWNIIEAFRETGLNTVESTCLMNQGRVMTLLASLYSNLNKRLPPGQNIDTDSIGSLISMWLLLALCNDKTNRIKVFSIKTSLALLCCGKLMDKLRYIFSLLADSNGLLIHERFAELVVEMNKLPSAVGEGRVYSMTETSPHNIFNQEAKINVNDFLERMMSDPGPHCVSWLLVLHRISGAESNYHPVSCSGCSREGFQGLRYKSDTANYHLCQLCFWRGNLSQQHKDDFFKEYSAWKTPGRHSGLRRSIRCVPQAPAQDMAQSTNFPRFPEKPEPTLDLTNIVPASPMPSHNGFNSAPATRRVSPATMSGMDRLAMTRLQGTSGSSPLPTRRMGGGGGEGGGGQVAPHMMPPQFNTLPQSRAPNQQHFIDKSNQRYGKGDEHELIASYANHLASHNQLDYLGLATGPNTVGAMEDDISYAAPKRDKGVEKNSRRLVYELEKKNAEIMREIARLRQNRATVQDMEKDPNVATELVLLRQRRSELEGRLSELQETRKDLMTELEELMKLLRVQGGGGGGAPPSQHRYETGVGAHRFDGAALAGAALAGAGRYGAPPEIAGARPSSRRDYSGSRLGYAAAAAPGGYTAPPPLERGTGGGGAHLGGAGSHLGGAGVAQYSGGWGGGAPSQLPSQRQEFKDDIMRGKSFQACQFSQATKHQNVGPSFTRPIPGLDSVARFQRVDSNGAHLDAVSPGGHHSNTRNGGGVEEDTTTTVSSPDTTSSVPASANSLSE